MPVLRRRFTVMSLAACVAVSLLGVAAQEPDGGAGFGDVFAAPQGRGGGGRGGRGAARGGPAPALPIGTASISGVVTLGGSGTPVRRARIALSGGDFRGVRTTMTADDGHFSFLALPAGRFTLTASKPGYASIAYGAKRPGRQGTPVQLADGQAITNADFSLPRGAVITGIVVDEYGEPSPNTPVRAYRFALLNGTRTLQSAGQDQTDDRGIYRIFQLLPGEYIVSAVPRNAATANLSAQIEARLQPLLDQVQASGGVGALMGVAATGAAIGAFGGPEGRGGPQLVQQIQQLQQQLAEQPDQSTGYAPVYYPGTTSPVQAARVALDAGQERAGVDFQLQLVPTASVQGQIVGTDALPPGSQVMLQTTSADVASNVPGGNSVSRLGPDGTFTFQNVTPGDYRLLARVPVRPDTGQAASEVTIQRGVGGRIQFAGRGGRGGPITQVLWAASDIAVNGQDISGLTLSLQPGLTISGRLAFESDVAAPPEDLTAARVSVVPVDAQAMGGMTPQDVDATGNFTITGIVPGRYGVTASLAGFARGRGGRAGTANGAGAWPGAQGSASWHLKSAIVNGVDVLDFPLEVEPSQSLSGMLVTFTDRTQQLTGTLQDALGRPTADYTIILFPADNRYWVPRSRRILSTRPSTDGTFSFSNFPAGQYRLTAVVDAEPGEWFDPAFLAQVVPASMLVSVAEGERKLQNIRLAQ